MKINNSHAGTFESGDILIQLFPPEKDGIEIELESSVANQFGEQIKKVIKDSLEEYGITDRPRESSRQRSSRLHHQGTCDSRSRACNRQRCLERLTFKYL